MIDCGIRSVRAQGFMGIYRGMGMTLLRDVPGYFAYFGKFIAPYKKKVVKHALL